MPENYVFTITFDSLKSYKTKVKMIDNLYNLFSRHIDAHAELFYTVEYHKKSDKKSNNYFRPHVHGILYSPNHLKLSSIRCLIDELKTSYGRMLQFSLQEDPDEVQGWKEYCLKDVDFNETYTKLPHKFIYGIVPKTPQELLWTQQQHVGDELDLSDDY